MMSLAAFGTERASASADALARGLGWFSIGLGVAELVAPRQLTRMLGMDGNEALVQSYGAREIATGVGILASQQPAPWIWGRVGGDVLDLATLAAGLDAENPKRGNVGLALAAVAGVTALDVLCASALSTGGGDSGHVPRHDYHGRSGFPRPPAAMRTSAKPFETPRDFRIPEPMRPYTSEKPAPREGNHGVTRARSAALPL
jgi:hypothetical protein